MDGSSNEPLPPSPYMIMQPGEGLFVGLRRMALEQLDVMMQGFHADGDDRLLDHGVHQARKAGKRIRSLVRLSREELGPDAYRCANEVVRDQGRRLSATRTARVLLRTVDTLTEDASVPREDVAQLREMLARRHAERLAHLRADHAGRSEARTALAILADQIDGLAEPAAYGTADLGAVVGAVKRSYRRARRGMRDAERLDSAHSFHEWRKRVNVLRYQLEALSGACEAPVSSLVATLDELSEIVGEDHDLADLRVVCDGAPGMVGEGLLGEVDRRSQTLRGVSLRAGSEIFAQKSGSFAQFFSEHARSAP